MTIAKVNKLRRLQADQKAELSLVAQRAKIRRRSQTLEENIQEGMNSYAERWEKQLKPQQRSSESDRFESGSGWKGRSTRTVGMRIGCWNMGGPHETKLGYDAGEGRTHTYYGRY